MPPTGLAPQPLVNSAAHLPLALLPELESPQVVQTGAVRREVEGAPALLVGVAPPEAVGVAAPLAEEAVPRVEVLTPHWSHGLGH